MEGITQKLVDFIQDIKYEDLPDEVVHEAKRVLLDSMGCAIAGLATDKGNLSVRLARRLGGPPESSIVGTKDKVSFAAAAFANSELINALDMDAILLPGHISPYVISAPLAIGETIASSGKDLILALAVGHEISRRLGGALTGMFKYDKAQGRLVEPEVHGFGFCIIGGTAATGKILGLEREKMRHAIGIAGHIAPVPGFRKWAETPPAAMTKYTAAGWVSQAEVTASLLADMGYTGDTSVLDGDYGFWKMFGSDKWEPETIFTELGEKWYFTETSYKPYPCCRCMQGSIDSLYKIMDNNHLSHHDIDNIKVLVGPDAEKPVWRNRELTTHLDSQFSIAYVFAVAAHRVEVGADWQDLDTITDPNILSFMNKVEFGRHPDFEKLAHQDARNMVSSIEVTAMGKTFKEEKTWAKGDSFLEEARMSDEDLVNKFRSNTCRTLTQDKIGNAIEAVFEFQNIRNISTLLSHLSI
ncbi:MmgE/PrpD family protein [Chloroflexota bacterium]